MSCSGIPAGYGENREQTEKQGADRKTGSRQKNREGRHRGLPLQEKEI